jgi:hypothetical protein
VAKVQGRLGKPWNALCATTAAGCAKAIPIDHGKANTPAPAAPPARPVRGVTSLKRTRRRGCPKASGPNSTRRVGAISGRGWKRPFDDPIPLPRGRQLDTLEDAAKYIQKLPKAEQHLGKWQAAVEAMLLVVEHNGPTMMARIGMLRALNRNVVREFNPDGKDAHWGRRKLARDR